MGGTVQEPFSGPSNQRTPKLMLNIKILGFYGKGLTQDKKYAEKFKKYNLKPGPIVGRLN